MPIEYTIYAYIEGYDKETDNCFEPDEVMEGSRTLFSSNDVHRAIEFLQSLPTKDDELEVNNGN